MSKREQLIDPALRSRLMLLCAAWELIDGGWCQKAYARDKWRHAVGPLAPQATRFCVGAVLYRAAVDLGLAEVDEDVFKAESWRPTGHLETAFRLVGKEFTRYGRVVGLELKQTAEGVSFVIPANEHGSPEWTMSLPWWRLVIIANDARKTSHKLVDAVMTFSILDLCNQIKIEVRAAATKLEEKK